MKTNLRSFAGGEITPEMFGRIDLTKYQTGLALCRNFVVLPHGPIARRPGTDYTNEAKDSTHSVRVVAFSYSASQTIVLEFGHLYLRFHTNGQTLLEANLTVTSIVGATVNVTAHGYLVGDWVYIGGRYYVVATAATNSFTVTTLTGAAGAPAGATSARVYTVTTPYTAAMLPGLKFAQNADVLTIASASVAVNGNITSGVATRELRRTSAVVWTLTTLSFVTTLAAPTGVTATPTTAVATNLTATSYGVTTIAVDGVTESAMSSSAVSTNNLTLAGNFNTITWTAATGGLRYNVYKLRGGIYGYIGQTTGLSVVDDNILADTVTTPPISSITLNADAVYFTDFPGATAYYEQRRWFANTPASPQNVWATRSATEANLTASIPSREDDALTFRLASTRQNAIQHLVPLQDMIALTAGGEFRIFSDGMPAITPTSISIKPQGAIGANQVQPVLANRSALYVQANGNRVREISSGGQATNYGYQSLDVTIMAPHLFNGYQIVDMAYADEPDKIVWCVRSDGVLLGMTYLPDQQVFAWHQHSTDGFFESVCSVNENNAAAAYAVVRRTIGSRSVRMIERLHARLFTAAPDAYFVDCGLTYSGTAATVISGLSHLEGKAVSVLADGAVVSGLVVAGGSITLPTAAAKVQVGLPYTSDATTLPIALDPSVASASGQGAPKNVSRVFLRVTQSSLVQAGPTFAKLTTYPARAVSDPYGSPPALRTGELAMSVSPSWNTDGAVCIRQGEPLPLMVLSMAIEVAAGG